jgi:predicted lipoprotein with Yx(FWY)xxD motif
VLGPPKVRFTYASDFRRRIAFGALVTVVAALFFAASAPSEPIRTVAPVVVLKDKTFGRILARRDRQALYTWRTERAAGGKIRCAGSCAKLWPPLIVKSASAVPAHIAGVKGVFGTIRRPDGRLQVTYKRVALYAYVHEGPNQVLCNNVNGWFVVRV